MPGALINHLCPQEVNPMLTIVTVAVPIVLVAIIAAIWSVVRDPTPPPRPPGCHRRRRDPHDPIRGDDEEPPEQHDL
jgi:hypothetical protein